MSDTTHDLPARVAVLEEIASSTRTAIAELRNEVREMRTEFRAELRTEAQSLRVELQGGLREVRAMQWSQFRWIVGIMLGGFGSLLGIAAHAAHLF